MTMLLTQAQDALARGNSREAQDLFFEVLKCDPLCTDAFRGLGLVVKCVAGDGSVELSVPELIARGIELDASGLHDAAILLYRGLVALRPFPPHDTYYLRTAIALGGDLFAFARLAAEVSQPKVDEAAILTNLACLLMNQRAYQQAIALFERVTLLLPEDANAHFNLAVCYDKLPSLQDRALNSVRRALRLNPRFNDARVLLAQLLRSTISPWHFPMLNDRPRNEAFLRAIESTVKPGSLVLDIGTGTGLLSMMSARAGASAVVACERSAELANCARRVIADNGFSETIRVINKSSLDLTVGDQGDLVRKADVVIAEIFDAGLLGEDAASIFTHARQHLLRAGGTLIPGGATVYAMLIESKTIAEERVVLEENTCGFKLDAINDYSSPLYFAVHLQRAHYRQLTAPIEMLQFQFSEPFPAIAHQASVTVSRTGCAHAVVFWFDLHLSPGVVFTTSPFSSDDSHWGQAAQVLSPFRNLNEGQSVHLGVSGGGQSYGRFTFDLSTG